ncbi:MAG: hypothetical protein IJT41_03020 [Clostridia bacterium]|nr:hypothetical protein [Clostridia bacterium]
MKIRIYMIIVLLLCLSLTGCGISSASQKYGNQGKSVDDVVQSQLSGSTRTPETTSGTVAEASPAQGRADAAETVDVDLTKLGSTMVYSEVYNMMNTPENYMGKRVRMQGAFAVAQGDNKYYYACLISDATACCAQGIEFVLKEERTYPDDYPQEGTEITVTGVFDTYNEGEHQYCQLVDAAME